MSFFHNIAKRIERHYRWSEEQDILKQLKKCGDNAHITYPFNVGCPSHIEIGKDTEIMANCRLHAYPDLTGKDANIVIGNHCFIGFRNTFLAGDDISIGDNVVTAADCCIVSHNHGINPESEVPYMDQPLTSAPTSIGDGTWLGHGVIVNAGVSIGNKCVIGAGAVVTKDIPDYSIAVGNPARVIKQYNFEKHSWEKI